MSKGTTAFERWMERRRLADAATEELYLNPLKIKIGEKLTIDLLDWDDLEFELTEIRVVERRIGEKVYPFVDYRLRAFGWEGSMDNQEILADLRYVPLSLHDREGGLNHQVFLLQLANECGYEEKLHKLLTSNPSEYTLLLGEEESVHFPARAENVELPYECRTTLIRDEDQDGEAEREEVQEDQMIYWDFWRTVSEEDGAEHLDYLFVEMNPKNGWTEFLQGGEINPDVISKL